MLQKFLSIAVITLYPSLLLAQQAVAPVIAPMGATQAQLNQVQSIVLDQEQQLQQLQQNLNTLRGENESLKHRIVQFENSQRNLLADMDQRLRNLESATPGVANPAANPAAIEPATTQAPTTQQNMEQTHQAPAEIPAAPPVSSGQIQANIADPKAQVAYQQIFAQLQNGQYAQAITGFQQFLQNYPQTIQAPDAQYWMGEAYYAQADYRNALNAFNQLLEKYPNSQKQADALLRMGFSYDALKDRKKARQVLKYVKGKYPGTATARLAETHLLKMK
ncbi:tol-pal system protein YbgF [Candidatus Venteria ishoeyi]|uniref:tol-pal system protein YbgF n=1 Tax=Candidatus Venteria ishoeyi TaxID=1899563 RepID=UPI0025A54855|nr:tol-pal system protein YbgF [Candidatus Venteria ishoeyi]MDM8545838.1 tol-pal system protein YbgF [Candidatus Venteria ishoeyi]